MSMGDGMKARLGMVDNYYILIQFPQITVRLTGRNRDLTYQKAYNLLGDLRVSARKYKKVRAPHGGGEYWYDKIDTQ